MMTNKLKKTIIDGVEVSPVLPSSIKNYLIDIDGTICDDIPNEQPELMKSAKLYPDALKTLNKWYDEGHIITFFTSRKEDHRNDTETWLKNNNFLFHNLLMGKPRGGNYVWIDNLFVKGVYFKNNWDETFDEVSNINVN